MSTMTYLLGGIAGLAAVKALFRPDRAIVKEGAVASCPGANKSRVCDASLAIDAPPGTPAYATSGGRVAAIGGSFIQLAAHDEPVVLMYDGITPAAGLVEGQYVGRGQYIGDSLGHVYFSVTEFLPGGAFHKIEPSAWLASRGQRIAANYTGRGTEWCEQGRNISVQLDAGRACDLYEPERGSFSLLPVTVSLQR